MESNIKEKIAVFIVYGIYLTIYLSVLITLKIKQWKQKKNRKRNL